jgi:hypothetical protein
LTIPESLYAAAAEQQDQRLTKDPWEDLLKNVSGITVVTATGQLQERISSIELLTFYLQLTPDRITDGHAKRLATVMRRLGWQGPEQLKGVENKFSTPRQATGDGNYVYKLINIRGYSRPTAGGWGCPHTRIEGGSGSVAGGSMGQVATCCRISH